MLAECKQAIGRATNNVAEYRGLIAGLEEAADVGATEVEVCMDSKLVVEQMSGRWRVKHPDLRRCISRRRRLVRAVRPHHLHLDPARREQPRRPAGQRSDGRRRRKSTLGREVLGQNGSRHHPAGWTGAAGRPTRLLLLRHGQTELSAQRRYSGRGNPALTELGRRQAERAPHGTSAQKGGIDAVVSSPLQRAYDTAAAAAKALGLDVVVDDDLIETDFGAWEGLTFGEAADRDPELHRRWLRDTAVPPPDGESFDAVAAPGATRAATDHRRACGGDRAGGVARDADQDAAADGARCGPERSCTGCISTWRRCRSRSSIRTVAASVRLVNQTAYL